MLTPFCGTLRGIGVASASFPLFPLQTAPPLLGCVELGLEEEEWECFPPLMPLRDSPFSNALVLLEGDCSPAARKGRGRLQLVAGGSEHGGDRVSARVFCNVTHVKSALKAAWLAQRGNPATYREWAQAPNKE